MAFPPNVYALYTLIPAAMIYRTLLFFMAGCFLMIACSRNTSSALVGQWQGTDDAGNNIRIEFTRQGEYHLFVNQRALIGSDTQPLKYQLLPQQTDHLEILLFEQESDVAQDRISRLQANFISRRQLLLVPSQEAQQSEGIQLTRL